MWACTLRISMSVYGYRLASAPNVSLHVSPPNINILRRRCSSIAPSTDIKRATASTKAGQLVLSHTRFLHHLISPYERVSSVRFWFHRKSASCVTRYIVTTRQWALSHSRAVRQTAYPWAARQTCGSSASTSSTVPAGRIIRASRVVVHVTACPWCIRRHDRLVIPATTTVTPARGRRRAIIVAAAAAPPPAPLRRLRGCWLERSPTRWTRRFRAAV
jgi:hypothetical protein